MSLYLDLAETAFGGRVRVTDECMTAAAAAEEEREWRKAARPTERAKGRATTDGRTHDTSYRETKDQRELCTFSTLAAY